MKKGYRVALLVLMVLVIDQASKFYIKLNFNCQEEVLMFGQRWARLHFIENEGMAFGITFDWEYGKLLLSAFRILMVAGLVYYIRLLISHRAPMGFVYSIGLITAGAVGNIIDSAFYGMIFNDPCTYHGDTLAQLVPFGQGYAHSDPLYGFLHGRVVDMLYFPMIEQQVIPDWMPLWGGERYTFFSAIFNMADASITCGVLCILLFQRRFFRDAMLHEDAPAPAGQEALAGAHMDAGTPGAPEEDMAPTAHGSVEMDDAAEPLSEREGPTGEEKM
ncbi:MAG TPA: lipoprotein signal peptidase [Saprospiraceae bacterium]|nr:lipoprotein signal peptidase [Saprospiraceae bacterium]